MKRLLINMQDFPSGGEDSAFTVHGGLMDDLNILTSCGGIGKALLILAQSSYWGGIDGLPEVWESSVNSPFNWNAGISAFQPDLKNNN